MSQESVTPLVKYHPRQLALKNYLSSAKVKAAILATLPTLAKQSGTTPDQIIGAALLACAKQPDLLECAEDSILRALLQCAELGLVAGSVTGEAYLIPYGKECQLQIGVRGFQRLAFETGRVTKIEARVVYETEVKQGKFQVTYEPQTKIQHIPELLEKLGPIVAAYAKASFRDAEPQYEILRKEDLDKIRAQAERIKPSPAWKVWPDQMAIKAAIKRLCKRLNLSSKSALARATYLDDRTEMGEFPIDVLSIEDVSTSDRDEKWVEDGTRPKIGTVDPAIFP